jgi:hypothetical protein
MVLFACNHAAAPAIIENRVKVFKHIASFSNNGGAYVWVYCFWRSPSDKDLNNSTTWDINNGIVLDEYHVLTTHCQDEKEVNGWDDGYLESITIGSPDANNQSGVGQWQARLEVEDANGADLVILTTNVPMTLPRVVMATKKTEIGDLLYSVSGVAGDANLRKVDLLRVNAQKYEGDPFEKQTSSQPDFAVLVPKDGNYPAPLGVFNQDDEFVGFVLEGSWSSVPVPLHAPDEFKSASSYVFGYDILSVQGDILKSLLQEAGVDSCY